MPKRRKTSAPLHLRAIGAGGTLFLALCNRAAQRPIDFAAIFVATALSAVIVVNALFLQTGSRSAAYLPPPTVAPAAPRGVLVSAPPAPAQVTGTAMSRPTEQIIAARSVANGVAAPQPVSARRDDPIADLIAPQPSPKVAAVQRALSEYGYGQIKASGVLDQPTTTAIEKFEREHKMPVTGHISERLVSQLGALVGHALN